MQEKNKSPETSTIEETSGIRLAVAPMLSPEQSYVDYQLLVDALTAKLGKKVRLIQKRDYQETNDLLRLRKCEFALMCGGAYVRAKRDFPLVPVVLPRVGGELTFHGCVIVRNDSGIRRFPELRGKSFAFVDPLSAAGYAFPVVLARRLGENPEKFFSSSVFTHSHDRLLISVLDRTVDGGAMSETVLNRLLKKMPEAAGQITIIERSADFRNMPLVARPDIPQELLNEVRATLLGAKKDPLFTEFLLRSGIDEFCEATDVSYKLVEDLFEEAMSEK